MFLCSKKCKWGYTGYHNNPKYWDTLSTYHTYPTVWNSPFFYFLICLRYCCMYDKQCRLWSYAAFCSVWSGSTLFVKAYLSQYLRLLWYIFVGKFSWFFCWFFSQIQFVYYFCQPFALQKSILMGKMTKIFGKQCRPCSALVAYCILSETFVYKILGHLPFSHTDTVDSRYLDPSYLDPITYVELISKSRLFSLCIDCISASHMSNFFYVDTSAISSIIFSPWIYFSQFLLPRISNSDHDEGKKI